MITVRCPYCDAEHIWDNDQESFIDKNAKPCPEDKENAFMEYGPVTYRYFCPFHDSPSEWLPVIATFIVDSYGSQLYVPCTENL
jgi:hypothetical protein